MSHDMAKKEKSKEETCRWEIYSVWGKIVAYNNTFPSFLCKLRKKKKQHLDELECYLKTTFICAKDFHEVFKTLQGVSTRKNILLMCSHNIVYS